MIGKVLSVKLSETSEFDSFIQLEQMSQWAQSPKMASFFYTFLWEDFWMIGIILCINLLIM